MTTKSILMAAFSFASAIGALAVPVTFQVDMSYQASQGAFDPGSNLVEARGSFNGWSGGFRLVATTENPTLYKGTIDVAGATGSTVNYKFVKVSGATDTWESNGDRAFALADAAQTLPVSFFSNQWDGAPLNVTFQVNMATQMAARNFDPAAGDVVEVRGEFNGWSGGSTLEPSVENPDVFVGTFSAGQAPGSGVSYKFHIQRASSDTWENDPNRQFAQTSVDQTLPVVYFNNVTGVPIKAALNFAVDLNAQIVGGKFDKATQEVWVRGNKFGWDVPPQGFQLIEDASRPGIYTNLFKTEGAITGDAIAYKFTIWDPTTFITTWEDGANKSVTFTGSEPSDAEGYHLKPIALTYFNNIAPGDLLSEDTVVTFRVDMTGAVQFGNSTPFDPANDGVWINGPFVNNGWGPWGGQNPELQLFDDGLTGGDTVAGDHIYSYQRTFARGSATRVVYKYGINSADNEAASGNDHVRYIRATGNFVMPLDKFGAPTQETLDLGSPTIQLNANGKITITWSGAAGVKLQKIDNLDNIAGATDVPNTDGQSSIELDATGTTGFFRLVRP